MDENINPTPAKKKKKKKREPCPYLRSGGKLLFSEKLNPEEMAGSAHRNSSKMTISRCPLLGKQFFNMTIVTFSLNTFSNHLFISHILNRYNNFSTKNPKKYNPNIRSYARTFSSGQTEKLYS